MTNFIEIKNTIEQLAKAGKYTEALNVYKANYTTISKQNMQAAPYLIACLINTYSKLHMHNSVANLLHYYSIFINASTATPIVTSYAWHLYFYTIAVQANSNQLHTVVANYLLPQLSQLLIASSGNTNTSLHTANNKACLTIMQQCKQLATIPWHNMASVLASVNIATLSTVPSSISTTSNNVVKNIELASTAEQYYCYLSEVQYALAQYTACSNTCQYALTNITKLHYGNQVWLSRRMACCYIAEQKFSAALLMYKKIIAQKQDWFLQYEIAKLYTTLGQAKLAWYHYCKACTTGTAYNYKLNLLQTMATILEQAGNMVIANTYYNAIYAIRQEQGWPIPVGLAAKVGAIVNKQVHSKQYIKELVATWAVGVKISNNKLVQGVVIKILHNNERGVNGFLKNENNGTIYFITKNSRNAKPLQIEIGTKLNYLLQTNGDKKFALIDSIVG